MKLLCSDFDKTLYVDDEEIVNKNINSIRKSLAEGNLFCIITGRNYTNIKELLVKYQIPYTYLICEDGAMIFNSEDLCINTTLLDKKVVLNLLPLIEKSGLSYYLDDGYKETDNLDSCIRIVVCMDEEQEKVKTLLQQILSTGDVYAYLSTEHLNIINKNVNKKLGVEKMIDIENIPRENVFVIGDSINDKEMIEAFSSAMMSVHHESLEEFKDLKKYNYLYEYIEELSQS